MFRWKRPYRDYWRMVGWYPLLVLTPGSIVFVAFDDGLHGQPLPPWHAFLASGLVTVWMWRLTRVGVLLDGDRIKVRTMFRTRVLRWDDVADVGDELDQELSFVLKSGQSVRTLVSPIFFGGYGVVMTQRQFTRLLTGLRERLAVAGRQGATVDGGRC